MFSGSASMHILTVPNGSSDFRFAFSFKKKPDFDGSKKKPGAPGFFHFFNGVSDGA